MTAMTDVELEAWLASRPASTTNIGAEVPALLEKIGEDARFFYCNGVDTEARALSFSPDAIELRGAVARLSAIVEAITNVAMLDV
jgi:hypothetical protein